MFTILRSSIRTRWMRMLATSIGILLGASLMTGTQVLTATLQASFDDLFEHSYSGIDVVVTPKSGVESLMARSYTGESVRLEESILPEIASLDSVDDVEGGLIGYAMIVAPDGTPIQPAGPPTLGTNWGTGSDLTALTVRSGRPPTGDGEVMVDAAVSRSHHIDVGDRITVIFTSRRDTFDVVGIAGYGSGDNLAGATMAVFDDATARQVLDAPRGWDQISVTAADGATPKQVQAEVDALLPATAEATLAADEAAQASEEVGEALSFLTTSLAAFSMIALFVAAFLIYNTVAITAAQRMREVALLRAIGATRWQVIRMVVAEALLFGLAAASIGAVAGVGVAWVLREAFLLVELGISRHALVVEPRALLLGVVAGAVVAVLAAVVPAIRASRVAPVAALRGEAARTNPQVRRLVPVVALLAAGGGAIVVAAGLTEALAMSLPIAAMAAGSTFLGIAVLMRYVVRAFARLLQLLPMRFPTAMLARTTIAREPQRVAAAAGALMVGLALVGFAATYGASAKASVTHSLEDRFRADLFVTSGNTTGSTGFSDAVGDRVRAADGVSDIARARLGMFELEGEAKYLVGADRDEAMSMVDLGVSDGSMSTLAGRQVAVHQAEAAAHDWKVGDTIEMSFERLGPTTMELVAIYSDNTIGGNYFVGMDFFEQAYRSRTLRTIVVRAEPGRVEEARTALDDIAAEFPGVLVLDQAELEAQIGATVDQLLAIVYLLLAFSLVTAMFGIVNTLALSVLERRRELGLERAVGMTRRQLRAVVRWEAALIATLGGTVGVALGFLFGAAAVRALEDQGLSVTVMPIGQGFLFVALAVAIAVLAASLPARRAARIPILEAIEHE